MFINASRNILLPHRRKQKFPDAKMQQTNICIVFLKAFMAGIWWLLWVFWALWQCSEGCSSWHFVSLCGRHLQRTGVGTLSMLCCCLLDSLIFIAVWKHVKMPTSVLPRLEGNTVLCLVALAMWTQQLSSDKRWLCGLETGMSTVP